MPPMSDSSSIIEEVPAVERNLAGRVKRRASGIVGNYRTFASRGTGEPIQGLDYIKDKPLDTCKESKVECEAANDSLADTYSSVEVEVDSQDEGANPLNVGKRVSDGESVANVGVGQGEVGFCDNVDVSAQAGRRGTEPRGDNKSGKIEKTKMADQEGDTSRSPTNGATSADNMDAKGGDNNQGDKGGTGARPTIFIPPPYPLMTRLLNPPILTSSKLDQMLPVWTNIHEK